MLPESLERTDNSFWMVLEGPDACGKSSQVSALVDYCTDLGLVVLRTAEPTMRTESGRALRAHGTEMTVRQQYMNFCIDRYHHLAEVVLPALRAGTIVIQDRYHLSTTIYQGRKMRNVSALAELHNRIWPKPDLTVVLDTDAEVLQDRLNKRGKDPWAGDYEELRSLAELYSITYPLVHNTARLLDCGNTQQEITNELVRLMRPRMVVCGVPKGEEDAQ